MSALNEPSPILKQQPTQELPQQNVIATGSGGQGAVSNAAPSLSQQASYLEKPDEIVSVKPNTTQPPLHQDFLPSIDGPPVSTNENHMNVVDSALATINTNRNDHDFQRLPTLQAPNSPLIRHQDTLPQMLISH